MSWLKPVAVDKHGPMYDRQDVNDMVVKQIGVNDYFSMRVKKMTQDSEKAKELVDQATDNFDVAIERMLKKNGMLEAETKKTSGNLRATAQKLSEGLTRIERAANFDRLERYVELLERAERAMSSLAELEKSGKLEKIAAAVR